MDYLGIPALLPPNPTTTTTTTPTTATTTTTTTTTAVPINGLTTTRVSGCFTETDFSYVGNDISITTVVSAGDCCNLCGSNEGCAVWTFTVATGQCNQKTIVGLTQRVASVGFVSGIIVLR